MAEPRTPQWEDNQKASEIAKFLREQGKEDYADMVIYFICEWATASGFAQGVLAMSKVLKPEREGE